MATHDTLETEILGQPVTFEYAEHWVGYSLFLLRLVMGWTLFQGGVTKLITYLDADPSNNWTAAGTSRTPSRRGTRSWGSGRRSPAVRSSTC